MIDDIEMAANIDETLSADSVDQSTSPVETPVDQTKAFAKRLKEEVEKARADEREKIAQSYGYESWDSYNRSQTDSKLLDNGLDPETVRPVLEDIIKSDPKYLEGIKYKEEKEKLESEIWAKQEIDRLNSKFKTKLKDVSDLDERTVNLWNNGMSLEQAYISQHFDEIQKNIIESTKTSIGSGKDHLSNVSGSSSTGGTREISRDELRIFKNINPDMSDEDIKAYINRTNK